MLVMDCYHSRFVTDGFRSTSSATLTTMSFAS